jgi:hypothetical protein
MQTGGSVLSEPWVHIFPPQIFQVLLEDRERAQGKGW